MRIITYKITTMQEIKIKTANEQSFVARLTPQVKKNTIIYE